MPEQLLESTEEAVNSPVCSDEGLTLETSAKHHILQATNIPYQPLLIKLIFSVLAHEEKNFVFFKTSLPVKGNSAEFLIFQRLYTFIKVQ